MFRCSDIPPVLKLAAVLRFFAEGGYQTGAGNDFHLVISQPTFSLILKETLDIFENFVCPKWISAVMTTAEKHEAKVAFYEATGFPGVTGCIDGTHIKIFAPPPHMRHLFYNRKGFYSLNAMIVSKNYKYNC